MGRPDRATDPDTSLQLLDEVAQVVFEQQAVWTSHDVRIVVRYLEGTYYVTSLYDEGRHLITTCDIQVVRRSIDNWRSCYSTLKLATVNLLDLIGRQIDPDQPLDHELLSEVRELL